MDGAVEVTEEKNVEINQGRWTREEHDLFLQGLKHHGKEWKKIADMIKTRTVVQIRTHAQKYFQKVAKNTGQPVMSTSKKGDVIRAPSRKARKTDESSPLSDSVSGDEETVESLSSPSPTTLSATPSSSSSFDPAIVKKPESIRVPNFHKPASKNKLGPLNIVDSKRTEEDRGGVTPRTVAAATILLRPRIQYKIQSGNDTPKTRETASWLESHQEQAAQVLGKRNRSTPSSSSSAKNNNAKGFSEPVALSWETAATHR